MQMGRIWAHHLSRLLMILMIGIVVAGCSLSSPLGGDSQSETFEGAPTVRLFSPLPNQTFLEGTTVNIQARVENAGTDIALLTIYLDDAVVGQVENPNPSGASAFSITQDWLTSVQGQYEISVVAERADGTANTPETVSVSVIKGADVPSGDTDTDTSTDDMTTDTDTDADSQTADDTTTDTDTSTSGQTTQDTTTDTDTSTSGQTTQDTTTQPTDVPAPTDPPQPTEPPPPTATATPSVPMARVISGANLRSGPSTVFEPPVGSIAANQEAEIVAVNPARDWYKIRYFNSTAWIFSSLVQTTGDLSRLPVDAGPPTPIPATNTPVVIPTDTPPPSQVNLVVTGIDISPHPLKCQEPSTITVTITNNGSAVAEGGGRILVEAILVSTGGTLESTETVFGAIPAGGSASADAVITVSTNFDELQRIRATVDVGNAIAESNEGDNATDVGTDYSLRKGNCQ